MANTVEIIITATDAATRVLKGVGGTLVKLAKTAKIAAVALGILGIASVKAFASFEDAFAGVRKTVDATEAEFKILSDAIRQMAKEIPASTVEISKVAEAAGQLGIQKENILDFTRTMVDLGNTTNLSSEMAASALARLANITQLSQDQFSNMGSAIVELGNNFATTEAEIVDMALNLAGAGTIIGLTEAEILGFSTALSSVGIRAERGGTAFQRVMVEIAKAAKGGGKILNDFAEIAGTSAEDFQKNFQDDAAGALIDFVEGLDRVSDSGKDTFKVLENLGFANIRVQDTLLRASGAGNLMREAIEASSVAFIKNTALTTEAEKRYATMTSKLKIVWNQIKDLGVVISGALSPFVIKAAEDIGTFADKAGEAFVLLPEILALSLDTMKVLFFKFFNDFSFFETLLKNAGIFGVELLQGFGNILIELGALLIKVGAVIFSPLAIAFDVLGSNIKFAWKIILQEVTLAALGVARKLAKTFNTIIPGDIFDFDLSGLDRSINVVKNNIIPLPKTFKQAFEELAPAITGIVLSMGDNFRRIGDNFSATFATLKGAIGEAAESPEIQALLGKVQALFTTLEGDAKTLGETIVNGITGGGEGGEGHAKISAFTEFIKSEFVDVGATMKDIWLSTREAFGDVVAGVIVEGESLADGLKNIFKSILSSVISMLVQIGIERAAQAILSSILNVKEATSRLAVLSAETYAGAFASTVAIPIVGPALAPGVAAASTAAMLAGAAVSGTAGATAGAAIAGVAGVAHAGLDNVPTDSTFLLKKGERVLSPGQNKDLKDFMKNGGNGGGITVKNLNILPGARLDESLMNAPKSFFRDFAKKILDELNVLGDQGYKTTLKQRESFF